MLGGLMDKPPMEWIDKLWDCMHLFYGEKWTNQFNKTIPSHIYKMVWQSALQGLTHEEIRNALVRYKRHAESSASIPPNHLGFHSFAKKGTLPPSRTVKRINDCEIKRDSEIAKRELDKIKAVLRNNSLMRST